MTTKTLLSFGLSEGNRVKYKKANNNICFCKISKNVWSKLYHAENSKTWGQTEQSQMIQLITSHLIRIYHISSVIRWIFFSSKTIPKI